MVTRTLVSASLCTKHETGIQAVNEPRAGTGRGKAQQFEQVSRFASLRATTADGEDRGLKYGGLDASGGVIREVRARRDRRHRRLVVDGALEHLARHSTVNLKRCRRQLFSSRLKAPCMSGRSDAESPDWAADEMRTLRTDRSEICCRLRLELRAGVYQR